MLVSSLELAAAAQQVDREGGMTPDCVKIKNDLSIIAARSAKRQTQRGPRDRQRIIG
jgi:hypothetical protein